MKRSLRLIAILACIALSAWPQQNDRVRVLAGRIADLNGSVVTSGRELSRELSGERANLLSELIALDPARALALALPQETAEWSGTLTGVVLDDFQNRRSTTEWRLRAAEGEFEAYFAGPAPHAGGVTVTVRGLRAGPRLAVSEIRAEQSAAAYSPLGEQSIAVLLVTTPSNPAFPAWSSAAFHQEVFFGPGTGQPETESLKGYWEQVSNGVATAAGQVFGPFALAADYTCSQYEDLARAAVNAADSSVDFSRFAHVVLVYPADSCTYAGLSTLGSATIDSPSKGKLTVSKTWLPIRISDPQPEYFRPLVAHELGHTLGLSHSRAANYGTVPLAGIDGPEPSLYEYGDQFSVMGDPSLSFGYYSANEQVRLGWINPNDYLEIDSPGTYTLQPLESSANPRAMRILRDSVSGTWLWLEYRQPIGVDYSFYSQAVGGFYVLVGNQSGLATIPVPPTEATVFNGALVRYEKAGSGDPYLLDFTPKSFVLDYLDSALPSGKSWSDPHSPLTIIIGEPRSNGLPVTVAYDKSCASISISSRSFDAQGGSASIEVTAPPTCDWVASASADWISIEGQTSGRGNGTVWFSVGPNSGERRLAYISLQRQSIALSQAASGPSVLGVTPSSGAGASGHFTFEFSNPPGPQSMTGAIVNFDGAPSCQAFIDVVNNSLSLLSDSGNSYLSAVRIGAGGGIASNGVCSVSGSASSISSQGGRLSIALEVAFAGVFAGAHGIIASPTPNPRAVNVGAWIVPKAPLATVTIASTALGAPFTVDRGRLYRAPATFDWEPGSRHTIEWLNSDPAKADVTYSFVNWSDGGDNPRLITAPGTSIVYTASVSAAGLGHLVQTIAGGLPTLTPSPGLSVALPNPHGFAMDRSGNMYISSPWMNVVYKMDSDGALTRFAGTGQQGDGGDGGPAVSAQLYNPQGLAVDLDGNVFIADAFNHLVRKVSPDGVISTMAGVRCCFDLGYGGPATRSRLAMPTSVAVDAIGNLYICDWLGVHMVGRDGLIRLLPQPPTAGQYYRPSAIATDLEGNLYIASSAITKLSKDGTFTTLVDYIGQIDAMAVDKDGNLFMSQASKVLRLAPGGQPEKLAGSAPLSTADGTPATRSRIRPLGLAVDNAGYIVFADDLGQSVRRFKPGGVITTIAGGNPAAAGRISSIPLNGPRGVAVDSAGDIYVADTRANRIRKISPDGNIATIAGTGVQGYTGDGGPAIRADLDSPGNIVLDSKSNLYFTVREPAGVRKITPDGTISTFIGGTYYGVAAGALAIDREDRLYIADTRTHNIIRVDQTGAVTTITEGGSFWVYGDGSFPGLAVDGAGNVYIGDPTSIRKITPAGAIETIVSLSIEAHAISDIAADEMGNVYFSETAWNTISKVTPAGAIQVLLGKDGTAATRDYVPGYYSGDGGPAKYAGMRRPETLALDKAGNIYVAESEGLVVRKLTPSGVDPVLTISVSHKNRFTGSTGEYSIKVSNALLAAATRGTVAVTDVVPLGLTVRAMYGDGWSCTGNTCTRSDTLSGGSYPRITVLVDISPDAPSQVTNQVIVTGGGAPAAGAQDLTEIWRAPAISPEGVVNAASYARGAAPGGLVSIFGSNFLGGRSGVVGASGSPLPLELGGTTVTLGERTLPILAVAGFDTFDQINVQIPYGIGGQTLPLKVSSGGLSGNSIDLQVSQAHPGIFMITSDLPAVVHSGDYALVTSNYPARPGEFVSVYCTGLGEVSPSVPEGAAAPSSPLSWTSNETTATMGGVRAEVNYSGLAPGFAGLYQVNVKVPDGTPSGRANLVITTAGVASQTVLLPIR